MDSQPKCSSKKPLGKILVIGAGFGRTGTLSLKEALETLGYSCYHMKELFHKRHSKLWMVEGEPDFTKIFSEYNATCDWPACSFYKEQFKRYPDAKVILTLRDPEKWYKSCLETIYELTHVLKFPLSFNSALKLSDKFVWMGTFKGRFKDKDYAISVYQKHVEEVQQTIPKEKLLLFDVASGWKPLCEFLSEPIPDVPFPHVNDTATMRKLIQTMRALQFGFWTLIVFIVSFIAYYISS